MWMTLLILRNPLFSSDKWTVCLSIQVNDHKINPRLLFCSQERVRHTHQECAILPAFKEEMHISPKSIRHGGSKTFQGSLEHLQLFNSQGENWTRQHLPHFLSLIINLITSFNTEGSLPSGCILIQTSCFQSADYPVPVSLSDQRGHSYRRLFWINLFRFASSRPDHCSTGIKQGVFFFNLKGIKCLFLGAQEAVKRNWRLSK